MIFVTVGTTHFSFDRLMMGVATLDVDDEIVVQRGPSRVALHNALVVDYESGSARSSRSLHETSGERFGDTG